MGLKKRKYDGMKRNDAHVANAIGGDAAVSTQEMAWDALTSEETCFVGDVFF